MKTNTSSTRKAGFTLVEIMVVVAIIGLLAAIGIPSFQKAQSNTRTKACQNNLRIIQDAKDMCTIDGAALTEVASYIRGNALPWCPADKAMSAPYMVGDEQTAPTCTAAH